MLPANMLATFKRGDQTAHLTFAQVEMGRRYTWRCRLALLNDKGEWMYTEHWPTNARKKAMREIESLGYVKV